MQMLTIFCYYSTMVLLVYLWAQLLNGYLPKLPTLNTFSLVCQCHKRLYRGGGGGGREAQRGDLSKTENGQMMRLSAIRHRKQPNHDPHQPASHVAIYMIQ